MSEDQITAAAPVPMPRIGDPAPAFTASTTQGSIDLPADYRGKWVILFSHPADFTPVCNTEFMTFAARQAEFARCEDWFFCTRELAADRIDAALTGAR